MDPVETGASMLAKKEYARAVPLLHAELEQYPNNPRIRLQYADALAGAGRPAEAIEQYEITAKYYDDNGLTVQAIAVRKKSDKLLEQLAPPDTDHDATTSKLHIRPRSRRPPQRDKVISAAEKLVAKGKIEEAIEEYSVLLEDNPNDVNTLNRIGDLWVRINRNDEAVKVFTKIADHYAKDGFFLKSIAIYKKVNKLDPSKLDVYAKLADLYAKQGLAMEAKSQYQVLADYYLKHGDPQAALAIYRKISDLDPNSIVVHVKLADLYAQNDRLAEALKEYDRVGRLLLKRGMTDEAAQVIRKALQLSPGDVALTASLGEALFAEKKTAESIDVITKALEQNAGEPSLTTLLARIHLTTGNVDAVQQLLVPFLLQTPAHHEAREVMADAYLLKSNANAALEVLRPAVDEARQRGDYARAMQLLRRIVDANAFHTPTIELIASIAGEKERSESTVKLRRHIQRQLAALAAGVNEQRLSRRLKSVFDAERSSENAVDDLVEWLAEPEQIVIFGAPGIGKSALLQELTWRLGQSSEGRLPLLVKLRTVAVSTFEDVIAHYLKFNDIDDVSLPVCKDLLEHGEAVLLADDMDGQSLAKALLQIRRADMRIVTTCSTNRPGIRQPGILFYDLLPLTTLQIHNVLKNHWRNERRVRQWMELIERDEGLAALCANPSTLNWIAEIDVERLFRFGEVEESDSVPIAEAYELLLRDLCERAQRIAGVPADDGLAGLAAIAIRLWASGSTTLPWQEAVDAFGARSPFGAQQLLDTFFVARDTSGNVSFAHPSMVEWLVAWSAAYSLSHGNSFPLVQAVMGPLAVEFFCDLTGYDAARTWAKSVLSQPDFSTNATENARRVLHHIEGETDVFQQPAEPERETVHVDVLTHEADAHEQRARNALARHDYHAAVVELTQCMSLDQIRAGRITAEFGFLLQTGSSANNGAGLRWCTNLWRVVTRAGELPVRTSVPSASRETPAEEPVAELPEPDDTPHEAAHPQALGEELEDAVLRLFRQFFSLADDNEGEFHVQLQKLRKQKTGSQFGYDIAFEATAAGNANVRCHVECKNYSSTISLKDVADKLLQQKAHGAPIDHWVLISPRADPSNDLHHFLEYESKALDFPFDILVWSPETGVGEFFGLEPMLYDKFYPDASPESHPREWPAEKRAAVIDRYSRLLRPVHRLPSGWNEYIDDERHLAFSDTEQYDFARTYASAVSLTLKDHSGVELPGTAIERLLAWLGEPSPRIAFVLGEFGDGKSFLTYSLARRLLQSFRDHPATGVVPLRMALREFMAAGNVREFLQARLEVFGADPAGWAALKREYKTLVILDGFDEISKELDPATITRNIRTLIDCSTAPVFDGSKILITSRTHFFETGDASRLLQRMENPLLLQLSRIPRAQVFGYLHESTKGSEERELLQRLARMHDPIGLGTKPLFLQMLKDTLHELPADLDEVTVYESYARRSLERKIELLDDPEFRSVRRESVEHLMSALGVIAEELQCSKEPYVSLKKLRLRTGPFAKLLWHMTGEDQLEADAEARIGTRSLLSRVNALGGDGQWLVDFCHRSIREYFVARQFFDCLARSSAEAADFLQRVPVNHEVLYFAACHLKRSRNDRAIAAVRELLCRSSVDGDAHALAGRALTLLLRVLPALPRDLDLKRRNFDYADLEDGDLSGLAFNGSTFRGANFANTNIEDADLSECDLTGVRLHETASVLALATMSGGKIFAAYEDGTIWEWNIAGGAKPSSRIVFSQPGLKLSRLGITQRGIGWGIAGREALLFDLSRGEWHCIAKIPLNPICADFNGDDRLLAVLFAEKTTHCIVVDLDQDSVTMQVPAGNSSVFAAPVATLLCIRADAASIQLINEANTVIRLETGNATAVHALSQPNGETLIATGESDGIVRVFRVSSGGVEVVFQDTIHSGPILSLVFTDPHTLISGGRDRRIALTPIGSTPGLVRHLRLNIRCKGLKICNLKPDDQRQRLEELIARAGS